MDDFAEIFSDPRVNPDKVHYDNPFDSPDYQRFVESMVPHCRCHAAIRPCDGVLAGGLCDNDQGEREDALADDFDEEESL